MKKFISIILALSLIAISGMTVAYAKGADYVYGDIDGDGSALANDALTSLQHSIGLINLDGEKFRLADVNGDNLVQSTDALLILQKSIGKISSLPAFGQTINTESIIQNGAYEEDTTADTSFEITPKGMDHKTIYYIDWSRISIGKDRYYVFDMVRFITCLQGLINRDFGKNHTTLLYISLDRYDINWYNYMGEKGKFFNGYTRHDIASVNELFEIFSEQIKQAGIILWDNEVASTCNVAETICGLDGYLPVRYDTEEGSFYNNIMSRGIEVKQSLVGMFKGYGTIPGTSIVSSGSTKNDAYLWALEKYMPRCSSKYIAYITDGATSCKGNPISTMSNYLSDPRYSSIPSLDYFIARRCFMFDLSGTGLEAPNDDPNQPLGTDYDTLLKILDARYERANGAFGEMFGFPPWHIKYTAEIVKEANPDVITNKCGAVEMEWKFAQVVSCYDLALEADAANPCYMSNGSVYYKYVTKVKKFENSHKYYDPDVAYFNNMNHYMCMYMGDYDSSAWLKTTGFDIWKDNCRGDVPLMWGFNPNLSNRIPMAFEYYYETMTPNDFIVAGDSGAGYINPSSVYQGYGSRTKPTMANEWAQYCDRYYKLFDINTTGFLLNGSSRLSDDVVRLYSRFSNNLSFHNCLDNDYRLCLYNGTAYCYLHNGIEVGKKLSPDGVLTITETNARIMYRHAHWRDLSAGIGPFNFSGYRFVLKTPSQVIEVFDTMAEYSREVQEDKTDYYIVDPETFTDLVIQSGQGRIVR